MFSNTITWIIINIIISILIIYGLHNCWDYLKNNFTTKKTKDLVNTQIQKYKKMMDEIQTAGSRDRLFETQEEKQSMNNDLMDFINQQVSNNSSENDYEKNIKTTL
jgi:hypothetical protein